MRVRACMRACECVCVCVEGGGRVRDRCLCLYVCSSIGGDGCCLRLFFSLVDGACGPGLYDRVK